MFREVEVYIDADRVLDQLEACDILDYFGYQDIMEEMETDKLCKAIGKCLLEHDAYKILEAIAPDLDLDDATETIKKINRSK